MPVDVIAFPPVGVVGTMWTATARAQRSQSLITGRRYVSAWGRERVMAALNVSALSLNRSGAGYSEMLKRYLNGGVNLVRLKGESINWHLDQRALEGLRSSQPLEWASAGNALAWQSGGQPLHWFTGRVVIGTAQGNHLTVENLPPDTLVCRPGDFVQAFANIDAVDGPIVQAVTEARTDLSGVATIRLFSALPAGNYPRVNIGASESRAFEAVEIPAEPQPIGRNWFLPWRFREVFADEVGGFNEVDPW